MQRLLEFLFQNPILLFILIAWVAGVVGNAVKATKRARERAEQMRRMPSAEPRPAAQPVATERQASPSAEEVAAEMRRILGMDPPARASRPPTAPTLPPSKPRRLAESERPPTPMVSTTQRRQLEIHVDPHVGEQIGKREAASRPRVETSELGTLGGRVQRPRRVREIADRFPRTNLRQALVLSEILGPPLALRPPDPARLQ